MNCCFTQNIIKQINSLIQLQVSIVIFIAKYNRYQIYEMNVLITMHFKNALWHITATKNSKIIRPHYQQR